MRCNECNVDLGEEYTKCPLCGAEASDDEPHLAGIKTAAYPIYDNDIKKKKYKYDFPLKFVLRISMAVCAVLGIVSLFTIGELWTYGCAAIVLLNSVIYFISGIFEEKGMLLHSLVALFSTFAFSLVTVIVSGIANCGFGESARALAVCAVLLVILCLIRRKRAAAQIRALFSL